jgi:hypothetical protein
MPIEVSKRQALEHVVRNSGKILEQPYLPVVAVAAGHVADGIVPLATEALGEVVERTYEVCVKSDNPYSKETQNNAAQSAIYDNEMLTLMIDSIGFLVTCAHIMRDNEIRKAKDSLYNDN